MAVARYRDIVICIHFFQIHNSHTDSAYCTTSQKPCRYRRCVISSVRNGYRAVQPLFKGFFRFLGLNVRKCQKLKLGLLRVFRF